MGNFLRFRSFHFLSGEVERVIARSSTIHKLALFCVACFDNSALALDKTCQLDAHIQRTEFADVAECILRLDRRVVDDGFHGGRAVFAVVPLFGRRKPADC